MSQFFINSLQNIHSYEDYTHEYLDKSLSALANSGQRFNIQPNGLKNKIISFGEILGVSGSSEEEKKYIAEVSIDTNKYELYININNNDKSIVKTINFNNTLILDPVKNNKIENIQYIFNHIDEFSSDSYVQINNNIFTGFLKGKLNQEENLSELIYFQFDINDNTLLHYISTKYYGILNESATNGEYYIVYQLDKINNEKYKLSTYLYTLDFLLGEINNKLSLNTNYIDEENSLLNKKYFENFYNFNQKNIDEDTNEIKTFSIFNNIFINYDKFLEISNNINELSFLNFIFCHNIKAYETNYIKLDDITIYKEDLSYRIEFNDLTNQTGYLTHNDLTKFIIDLQNLSNLYYQLYIIFNEQNYFSILESNYIYKHILYNLYKKIRENSTIKSSNTKLNDKLYIPLDYHFNCYISDQNESIIYYIDNIYVKTISVYNQKLITNQSNKIYYYNIDEIDHIDIYNVNIDYNTILKNNVINSIIVNKLYTLPYINKLNNWVIDNEDTNTSILNNQYTGIKELYIYSVKQGDSDSYSAKLLNISDESILSNINYINEQFKINPNLFLKYSNAEIYCGTSIPEINSNNKDFFKNTLIISISSNSNIKSVGENDYKTDYQLDYVYSLWKPNFNLEIPKFEVITLDDSENIDNDFAFDPFNNYEIYSRNNYKYKYITGFYTYKQNNDQSSKIIDDNYIAVLRNKQGSYYHPYYYNDYNFTLEYLIDKNIEENGDNNKYDNNKFINQINKLNVTNLIYPQYTLYTTVQTIAEAKREIHNIDLNIYTAYISIAINNQNQTLIEIRNDMNTIAVLDEIEEIEETQQEVQIGIWLNNIENSSIGQNFKEYVFNQDIPSIDLKETFVRNANTLNRVNILGIDKTNNIISDDEQEEITQIYNGYIGTNYYEDHKDILHISTSNENINIGYDTLLNINQINKFTPYKTLSIDGFETFEVKNKDTNSSDLSTIFETNSINIQLYKPVINKYGDDLISSSSVVHGLCRYLLLLHLSPDSNSTNYIINNLSIDTDDTSNGVSNIDKMLFLPIVTETHEVDAYNVQVDFMYKLLYNTVNLNKYIQDIFNIDISTGLYNIDYDDSHIIRLQQSENKTIYLLIIDDKRLRKLETSLLNSNGFMEMNSYNEFKNRIYGNTNRIYNYQLNITIDDKDILINFENHHCTDLTDLYFNDEFKNNILNVFTSQFNQDNQIPFIFNDVLNVYQLSN